MVYNIIIVPWWQFMQCWKAMLWSSPWSLPPSICYIQHFLHPWSGRLIVGPYYTIEYLEASFSGLVSHWADFYDFVGFGKGFITGIEDSISLARGVGWGYPYASVKVLSCLFPILDA